MSGSTAACILTRAAWALWSVQGSQPVGLPESCPGWLHLSCCQVPSPTSSAWWAGLFGAEEGCLTQAHTVTQGLALGGSGAWPGEPPWEVMAGSGGCFAVGRVFVSVCVCVWGWSPGRPPSLHLCLYWLLFPHCAGLCPSTPGHLL